MVLNAGWKGPLPKPGRIDPQSAQSRNAKTARVNAYHRGQAGHHAQFILGNTAGNDAVGGWLQQAAAQAQQDHLNCEVPDFQRPDDQSQPCVGNGHEPKATQYQGPFANDLHQLTGYPRADTERHRLYGQQHADRQRIQSHQHFKIERQD